MEEVNMNQLNNNQIQFLREKLQKEVRLYIEMDDKIKALNKAAKEYRKSKDELSASILETMKKFEINDMNIKSGKLIYNERKTKKRNETSPGGSGSNPAPGVRWPGPLGPLRWKAAAAHIRRAARH